MTFASPWFASLYLTAFAAALVVLTLARRWAPNVVVVLAGYAVAGAAFCAGLAVRGTHADISGGTFSLPPVAVAVVLPARFGPANGRDGELSIDIFANAADAHGIVPSLALRARQSAEITGWAFDAPEHRRCNGVAAMVDDRPFAGTYGLDRADVAAMFGEDHRLTGYRIIVSARAAGRGSHRVTVRCLGSAGRTYEAGATYTLEVRP